MRPIDLLSEELNYELRIRGIVSQRKDASQKRKILHKQLEKERGRDLEYVDPEYQFDSEREVIDNTLESLTQLISEFEGPESDSLYKRIQSRIVYLINRVKRIKPENANPEIIEYKNEAYASCLELEVLLSEKVTHDDGHNMSMMGAGHLTNPPLPQTIIQSTPSHSSYPVWKWNVKFSGDKNSDLLSFLVAIDELCVSRHVDKKELFDSAVELFSGHALCWFRSVKASMNNWDSLVEALKREFLPADYVDHIWEQIRNRRQERSEPIHVFVAAMENLFAHLGQYVAESTKVKYIRKNLSPFYINQLALINLVSTSDIIANCRKIDEAYQLANANKFKRLSISDNKAISGTNNSFEESAIEGHSSNAPVCSNTGARTKTYSRSSFSKSSPRAKEGPISNKNSNLSKPSSHSNSALKCFNCGQPNHAFKHCLARRRRFCYRCGKSDVTLRECSCSKNE